MLWVVDWSTNICHPCGSQLNLTTVTWPQINQLQAALHPQNSQLYNKNLYILIIIAGLHMTSWRPCWCLIIIAFLISFSCLYKLCAISPGIHCKPAGYEQESFSYELEVVTVRFVPCRDSIPPSIDSIQAFWFVEKWFCMLWLVE